MSLEDKCSLQTRFCNVELHVNPARDYTYKIILLYINLFFLSQ